MRLGEFLSTHGLKLELAPSGDSHFTTTVRKSNGDKVEILDRNNSGPIPGYGGYGQTPDIAVQNLCKDMTGRTMVLSQRKRIQVPSELVL